MKNVIKESVIFALLFLISACSQQPMPTATPLPTTTSTPTVTPTKTPVPTATITPTQDVEAYYYSLLPEIPAGFEWKIITEEKIAVVIPDGWFFKKETREELKLDGFYVTRENIDEVGRFSTGLTVFIFKGFETEAEAEQFAIDFLRLHMELETTKEVINAWDYEAGAAVVHHLRIKAEYPYETEVNRNKTVQYSTVTVNKQVYVSIFECPDEIAEEIFSDYGLLLDYVIIFGK